MDKIMNLLDSKLTPIAANIGGNKYLKAISAGFIATMAATIVGSMFTLLLNLPIPGWVEWLNSIGLAQILALPSQATIDLIALYAVFFIAYTLADDNGVDGSGAGLSVLVSFLLLTGRTSYYTSAAADAVMEGAYSVSFLGAKGLFTAIIVGLLGSKLYISVVKKGWVIKLPDSVPPNVGNSFSSLIPAAIVITVFLIVAGIMIQTPYGNLHQMIFSVIQANLMRFMGNNIISWGFSNVMTNILWFFGLHGGNIVGSVFNPIYTPLALENLAAFQAHLPLPYIFTGMSFTKAFTAGGVGSMFGLAILMVTKGQSKQFKILGKLSLPTTLFFINEPLLFGVPIVLNPLFFIPLMVITPLLGSITYFVMKAGIIPAAAGLQIPWTTPPVLHGFLQGGWKLAAWEGLMVLSSIVLWFPFFKLADQKALEEEQNEEQNS